MSGGQFNVPVVIRMTTGGGRQLAAQHSHSLEGYYAHIPGLRVVAPATVADARGMLWTSLEDPDPVVIFEHGSLYNSSGDIPGDAGAVDIDRAVVRRAGSDLTIVTYGGSLGPCLLAGQSLAEEGVEAEVVDLRTLRPIDDETVFASVARTHRALVVDEGWRSVGMSAEIAARIAEECFYDLDAPVARVAALEVPIPYPRHLEQAVLPNVDRIRAGARQVVTGRE
jgi:pyruvate dehydrogenase E1 component beta subunit